MKYLQKVYRLASLLFTVFFILAFKACVLEDPVLLDQALDYGFPTNDEQMIDVREGMPEAGTNMMNNPLLAGGLDQAGTTSMEQQQWPQLSGYWQIEHHTTLRSELPVLLEEIETVIKATLIAEITQDGSQLWIHHKICDVNMQNQPGYNQTLIPDRFIQALPSKTRSAILMKEMTTDEDQLNPKFSFMAPIWYDLRGVYLDQPSQDPLPLAADDPRVFDQDLDGAPGLSASLIGFPDGEVSLIQKSWDEWYGQVDTSLDEEGRMKVSAIHGEIIWGQEQQIIEASNEVLLIDINRWIPEEPNLHYFDIVPIRELVCPPRRAPPSLD